MRTSVEMAVLAALAVAFLVVSFIVQNPFAKDANPVQAIGIILAAGLTLVMYSFLYRDNPMFKVAENLYVGVTLGYSAVMMWRRVLCPEVYEPLFSAPTSAAFWAELQYRAIPIILGILLMTRLSRKYGWLSRYAYAPLVGYGAGMGIAFSTHSYILKQLESAVAPFQEAGAKAVQFDPMTHPFLAANPWIAQAIAIFGTVFILVGTVAVLWYFFFSVEHKRAGAGFSKLGILFLMVCFGASFGYTVMGRVSLLIGRVQFLLFDWLNIAK
jgi:hypothetical protein